MKFRNIVFLVCAFLCFSSVSLFSAELWHLQDEETGNTLGYVYRDAGESTFYSSAWKDRVEEEREEGPEAQYSYYASGNLKILVRIDFVEEKPEGY